MKEVKAFCYRCLSAPKMNVLRVVKAIPPTDEMGEIRVEVECPNCGNVFKYDIPVLPKEMPHEYAN